MFGSKAAIRKYQQTLPQALSERYGRAKQYTKGQIDTTINELNLNSKHIVYAYVLYCDINELEPAMFDDYELEQMHTTIASALKGSIFAKAMNSVLLKAGLSGGGFGDGGSGGGE
ncbi:DUF6559 family protein [Pseudoalteromonas sp. GB56]